MQAEPAMNGPVWPRNGIAREAAGLAALAVVMVACSSTVAPSTTVEAEPPDRTPASSTAAGSSPLPSSTTAPFHAPGPGESFVEGSIEHIEWLVQCAAENGEAVQAVYGNPPAVEWSGTSLRTEQIVNQCSDAGMDAGWIIPSPFDGSAEGNRLMYRLWLPVHECLVANRYPSVEPPSEEAFIDQGSQLWNPYAGFPSGAPLVVANAATASADERRQLEAQDECGASAAALYQEQLEEEGG